MANVSRIPKNETEWIEEAVIQVLKTHGAVLSANPLGRSSRPTPDYEICSPEDGKAWLEVTQLTDCEARKLFNEGRMEIQSDKLLETFVLTVTPGVSYKLIRKNEQELIDLLVNVEQHLLSRDEANRQIAKANLRIVQHEHRGRQGRVIIHPVGRMDEAIWVENTKHLNQGVQSCIDRKDEHGQMKDTPEGYRRWLAVWIDLFVSEAFLELYDREKSASLVLYPKCFDVVWMICRWNDQAVLLRYPGDGLPVRVPFDPSQLRPLESRIFLPKESRSSSYSPLWTPPRG